MARQQRERMAAVLAGNLPPPGAEEPVPATAAGDGDVDMPQAGPLAAGGEEGAPGGGQVRLSKEEEAARREVAFEEELKKVGGGVGPSSQPVRGKQEKEQGGCFMVFKTSLCIDL